jgi:hypothetical protein
VLPSIGACPDVCSVMGDCISDLLMGPSRAFANPQVEGISIDEEGLAYLGELSEGTSLRHAVQLLTPAATLAATNGRDDVTRVDLEEVGAAAV